MADVKINMMLVDQGNSVKKKTGDVKELNGELTKSQKLARSAFSRSGGGVPQGQELEDFNKVRGAVGTGAAGRDFANQAQGLGGVVRLYATFAANIFAVSSAFQALQQAANFERLIQASKMLSERTGTDLNQLGKNLQAVTGYAISFEDAMQFANLGTSAGIAAKQMESLVQIAKGAAAGLGRDVNDSVRRIIQGTAKQEQEILDELGIFIKAKKAYEDYAKAFQIEGGADALSAQQRVAAYANAVEQAGSKWKDFATLDDPFARFVATGKEALTEILNFINQGIKPLLGFLAQSKDAVIALSLAISGILLKRALPELKTIALDLFTFNSAQAKAKAAELRIGIAKEMAIIANTIQAEQAKLAALAANTQAITMQTIAGTLAPGMLAATDAAGRAKGAGISQKRLETAVLGTQAKPVDLASYKQVADLEEKYVRAIKQSVDGNQVKLDQMKQLGVLQATSTLSEYKLSDAVKKSAQEIFTKVQQYNSGLITRQQLMQNIVALEEKSAVLNTRFAATTPGQVQAVGRMYGQQAPDFVGPTRPTIGQRVVGAVGAAGGTMAATGQTIRAGASNYMEALGQVSQSTQRYGDVIGAPFLTRMKSFGNILQDNITVAKNATGVMGKLGASVGIAGQLIGGAFRGIMAAFGPLMIMWTLWELFGEKLMPDSWKAAQEMSKKQQELVDTSGAVGSSLERVNGVLQKGTKNIEEYGQTVDIVIKAVQSQIDSLSKVLDQAEKKQAESLLEKARKDAASAERAFSEQSYAIDQLLKSGLYDPKTKSELQDLRFAYEEYVNAQEQDVEVKKKLDTRARTALQETQKYQQQLRAEINITEANKKATEEALDSIDKKLKGIPKFGEIAGTEEARAFAKTFDDAFKPKMNVESASKAMQELQSSLQELANRGILEAGMALQLLGGQIQEVGVEETLKWARSNAVLKQILDSVVQRVTNITDKYSPAAKRAFSELTKQVDSLGISIKSLELSMLKSAAFDRAIESLRGYSTEIEIAKRKEQEIQKARLEYSRELVSAQLELDKVLKDTSAASKPDETQAARQRYNVRVQEAKIARDSAVFTAETAAENKTLDNILKQISEKYEAINSKIQIQNARTEGSLRLEQERLRILKEAGALSEPRIVEMETQTQGRQIQQTFKESSVAASNAAEEERAKIQERYNLAIKDAGFDLNKISMAIQAQREARSKVNAKERDALTLAGLRRDNELEILRISSEARKVYAELAEAEKTRAQQEALRATKLEAEKQLVDLQKEELQYKLDLGLITQDLYDKEVNGINKAIRAREYQNKLLEIEAKYKREIDKVAADATVAGIAGGLDETGTGMLTLEQAEAFNKRKEAAKSQRDAEIKGAQDVYSANERLKGMYESMSTEQKGLASIYKDTFAAMGDAIVNFVRTGKLSFKDLVNDMLSQLLRLYTNKIFTQLFSSLLGGGFLPGLGGGGSFTALPSTGGISQNPFGFAMGGAFDDGIKKYAKGGMFTNSIVDSPTMFKFAKGTGLMGEAGPEAIMPLKRDSQGNLGVRGGGGSVEVVVNNYSTEKAEARETTDSRGNRRIEVVVGDMTAGEVTRGGSSTNRAITNTFGMKPQLIRR
jgi:lambda family phage tail tape measure protein